MKLLFLIADGMGDWPLDELGGLTPLAAAATPVMDDMARTGALGLCQTVPAGMPPGSDVANMSLLGFDPASHHTGRGPIEAAAQGLDLDPDDLVWRMNLVTVSEFTDQGLMRDYSAGHIGNAEAGALIAKLAAELGRDGFEIHPGVQYRHLLIQKGGATSPEARLTVRPPHDITNGPMRPDMEQYASSPRLKDLTDRAAAILAGPDNPTKANAVWPWGQGRPLILPDFAQAFGLRGAVISAVDLIKGLGRAAGMTVLDIPGATGLLDTNYEGKVEAALRFLEEGDFVFLHVEAPDECGHMGKAGDKVESIRRFDARVVAPLRQALAGRKDVGFLIACDHLTPIVKLTHVSDPVPFLFWSEGMADSAAATARTFTEAECARTGLFLSAGPELLPWTLGRLG